MSRTHIANERQDLSTAPQRPARRQKPAQEPKLTGPPFVIYHRVSTKRQGESGLGLEAQDRMTAEYLTRVAGINLATFTEIETGKRNDRPELRKATILARRKKATILVAKLDRLARNVAFVATMLDSGVEFVAADCPQASRMMLQMLSVFAEYEAKCISERTKAGLESRRLRGFKLGNIENLRRGGSPAPEQNRAAAAAEAERMRPIVASLAGERITSVRAVCNALNDRGYPTRKGLSWHPTTVRRLLDRLKGRDAGRKPQEPPAAEPGPVQRGELAG